MYSILQDIYSGIFGSINSKAKREREGGKGKEDFVIFLFLLSGNISLYHKFSLGVILANK
jgi:hypothetical protein